MKTKLDLTQLDAWKHEVEKEVDRIVRKRFPNCRTFAYLMLVTDTGAGGFTAVRTVGEFWQLDEKTIEKVAEIQTADLELQAAGGNPPKRGRKKGGAS